MIISLCIPTNGVEEWIFPVLQSIYEEKVDEALFQVVVTDNGNNGAFCQKMLAFQKEHHNLIYEKTDAPLFLNEIEAYKRADGCFIKFINHRTLLLPGALSEWIKFVEDNIREKPIVYFSNGVLSKPNEIFIKNNFDAFVKELSYWSSWSTGMGFWKEDFEKVLGKEDFNELFPHTTILFHETERSSYIIDNRVMLKELPTGKTPKGHYDLFYAFAVEYVSILLELCRNNTLSLESFLKLKEDNLDFISIIYNNFILKKQFCSYDLSSYENAIQVFYSHEQLIDVLRKKGWKSD